MSGVTARIRQRLEFHDEARWKRFLARRLRLIEEHGLYARKASDQDAEVNRTARILQDEFGIPESHLDDVDRLVRAAIQSIRRNRKRLLKGREGLRVREYEQHPESEDTYLRTSSRSSLRDERGPPKAECSIRSLSMSDVSRPVASSSTPNTKLARSSDIFELNGDIKRRRVDVAPSTIERLLQPLALKPSFTSNRSASVLAQTRLLDMVLLLRSVADSAQRDRCLALGESTIAAVSARIALCAKDSEAADHLRKTLTSDTMAAKMIFSVDALDPALDTETAAATWRAIVGCYAADFGFDALANALEQLMRELLASDHPGLHLERRQDTSAVPVEILFHGRRLAMSFERALRDAPSVMEVVHNSKAAFGIARDDARALTLRDEEGNIINTDLELAKLLRGSDKVVLQLGFLSENKPQLSLKLPSLSSSLGVDGGLPLPPLSNRSPFGGYARVLLERGTLKFEKLL